MNSGTERELADLQEQLRRLKRELRETYAVKAAWGNLLTMLKERLGEAERLLKPSIHTNAKVKAHFQKWDDIAEGRALWGGVDGRPEATT